MLPMMRFLLLVVTVVMVVMMLLVALMLMLALMSLRRVPGRGVLVRMMLVGAHFD